MRLVGPVLAAEARALVAGDVEPWKATDVVRDRRVIRGRKPKRRQIEAVVGWIGVGAADEPVVPVAEIQDRAVVERVDVIERRLTGDELEPFTGREVVEIVVVVAVPVVPAVAPVHTLPVADD